MPSQDTLAVVLNPELVKRVRDTANRETISNSAVVRRALRLYFFGPTITDSHSQNHSQKDSPEGDLLVGVSEDVA